MEISSRCKCLSSVLTPSTVSTGTSCMLYMQTGVQMWEVHILNNCRIFKYLYLRTFFLTTFYFYINLAQRWNERRCPGRSPGKLQLQYFSI